MLRRFISIMLCLIIMFVSGIAFAESGEERGNLEERFGDVETIDYNGTTYYQKSRITSMLFAGVYDDGSALGRIGYLTAVVVDDNQKKITPVMLDYRTLVKDANGAQTTLKDIYNNSTTKEEACENITAAINSLFHSTLIEFYFGLDINGLKLIDEKDFSINEEEDPQIKTKERLKEIKVYADSMSANSASEMMDKLSAYIHTNMKSGALMKIVDKADRYDVCASIHPKTVMFYEDGEISEDLLSEEDIDPEDILLVMDEDALLLDAISLFYDEIYW